MTFKVNNDILSTWVYTNLPYYYYEFILLQLLSKIQRAFYLLPCLRAPFLYSTKKLIEKEVILTVNDKIVETFLSMIQPLMLQHIKELYLFGSRCRDDWKPDSDYDLLIIIEKKDRLIIDTLYDAVIDTLLYTDRLISLKIFTASEFNRLKSIPTPFVSNVLREAIKLA